jgi:DNA invertase Pin-like site-specific DNA recombinase
MEKKVLIWVRCSTVKQDTERQIDDLTNFATKNGWQVVDVISENISGAVKNEKRPAIQSILHRGMDKAFDMVLVSELSRIGRNAFEVQKVIEHLTEYKIPIYLQNMNIATLDDKGQRNPMVDMLVAVINQFSTLERSNLIFRVKSGIAKAQANGVHCGRPKDSKVSVEQFLERYSYVAMVLSEGLSLRKTARLFKFSLATVMKVKCLSKFYTIGLENASQVIAPWGLFVIILSVFYVRVY